VELIRLRGVSVSSGIVGDAGGEVLVAILQILRSIKYSSYDLAVKLLWSDILPSGGLWHISRHDLRDIRSPCHEHDFYELFWVETGSGVHRLNEERYRMGPGELWFVRPEDRHRPQADARLGLTMVNLAIHARHLEALERRYAADTIWPWTTAATPRMHSLHPHQLQRLHAWAGQLAAMDQCPAWIDGMILTVVNLCQQAAASTTAPMPPLANRPGQPAPPPWLSRAIDDFDQLETMSMRPGDFAHLAHRTPEHVNRTMQRVYGCDTTTKLNERRMLRAGIALRMNRKSILHAAQACGFASLTHFYRCFKKHYGMTPRQYVRRASEPLKPAGRSSLRRSRS
jgi:AraC-like DNA-binding protein/mannose-6-phosphate isomerase-like protein (cupin superfamily)